MAKKESSSPKSIIDVMNNIDSIINKLPVEDREKLMENLRLLSEMQSESQGFGSKIDDIAQDNCDDEDDYKDSYPRYKMSTSIKKYTLRFTLRYISPSIWRKVEVPSNITLRHLSELIIEVMGWYGSHLNQFCHKDHFYAPKEQQEYSFDSGLSFDEEFNHNSEDYTIADILTEKGKSVTFEYDFGDGWEHEIKLSSVDDYKEDEERKIRFVSGKRACPPEDCGGYYGYEEICKLATSGKKKDLKTLENTYGIFDYDPEKFYKDEAEEICDRYND